MFGHVSYYLSPVEAINVLLDEYEYCGKIKDID
jgi:hypothetical protein